MTTVMAHYQMTLLTKSEADKQAVKELIEKEGGTVTDERPLGERPLAYPIKKERHAYFTALRFTLPGEQVLELNRELLLSGHVLRHMVTTARAKTPVATSLIDQPLRKAAKAEVLSQAEPAKEESPKKKTKDQLRAEKQATADRQKKIEAELAKILSEE
jgi:ribosomal protein S6